MNLIQFKIIPALFALLVLTLSWDYPPAGPEIVFNIYHRTNLTAAWELLGTTSEKSFRVPASMPMEFFTVTASNTITGLESDYAK